MRDYAQEYQANIKLLDSFLAPFHQGILTPDKSKGLTWLLHLWPLWYSFLWIIFYAYLILVHTAGPEIVSQQMLGMFCIVQLAAKQLNAKWQVGRLRKLLKWCESVYTSQLSKVEYQRVVDRVFEETNPTIRMCIRINCVLLGSAAASYLLQPMLRGNRETPTLVSINDTVYWPMHIFLAIYVGQVVYGLCVCFLLSGYDAIFVQLIMTMSYRFRAMSRISQILNRLAKGCERDHERDTEIIGLVYKMHLSVLGATADFRRYYSVYGLIQLGSNLFMNCSLLYILQMNGYDSNIFVILLSSSLQILIVSAFGQQLQNEANVFRGTLYSVDWPNMSIDNRKRILLLMSGSYRGVTVRAGGTLELNLALFAQVMKAGVSLCAVMRAM